MFSFMTYCTKTYQKNEMQVNAVQVYRSTPLRSEQTFCKCTGILHSAVNTLSQQSCKLQLLLSFNFTYYTPFLRDTQ